VTTNEQTCLRCGTVNAVDAKFCSKCGNPLGAPPPQQSASFASQFGSGGGAGNMRSALLTIDPNQAFAVFSQAVTSLGGIINDQSPPNQIRFTVPYKDTWTTLGLTARLDGEVRIIPDAQSGSKVTITTGVNVNSLIPLFIILVVIGIFAFFFGALVGALCDVYIYFKLNGEISSNLAKSILERATDAASKVTVEHGKA
jgi:hypothetical protein